MPDPQYGLNLTNLDLRPLSPYWPERLDFPGDTCAGGHPFHPDDVTGECLNCLAILAKGRDTAEEAADYRVLADHIIALLNPESHEDAEVLACMNALSGIATYVESLKCRCSIKQDGSACPRCRALGRHRDEKVQRDSAVD